MLVLVSDDPTSGTVPQESLEGDRDSAQRQIPLDVVLHVSRAGHSIMARSLLDASATLGYPLDRHHLALVVWRARQCRDAV